jgi:hypothetical protein
MAVAGAVVAGGALVRWHSQLPKVFLLSLAVLLCGYALLTRGFAYLRIPPLYVGEAVLVLGIVAAHRGLVETLRLPLSSLSIAFVGWGALCTIPYLPRHGIDALRDSAVWTYSAFGQIVAVLAVRSHLRFQRLPRIYDRCSIPFSAWTLIAFFVYYSRPTWMPSAPGSDVPLLVFLGGETGVHLAGIGSFMLLGFQTGGVIRQSLAWMLWLAGFVAIACVNRGGMLAILAGVFVALLLQARLSVWLRVAFFALASMTLLAVGAEIDVGAPRPVSGKQLVANLRSVMGGTDRGLGSTREWRLSWWSEIVDYTFLGPYFWTGKGFGVNLADSDGYQVGTKDKPLRSPHNGHMTILARSGVPGFALWVLLQGAFALSLLTAHQRARRRRDDGFARILAWILAYWTGAQVNIAFTTALESPQAGIWFWSIFGYGLAVLAEDRRRVREGSPTRRDDPAAPSGRRKGKTGQSAGEFLRSRELGG